ncbi:MAG TPA: TraM recognition domain-containing protein [Acidimicrobiales bacterium]|nr:TraM recognition domain-containing protein [Acidimicrobiales bacterium]
MDGALTAWFAPPSVVLPVASPRVLPIAAGALLACLIVSAAPLGRRVVGGRRVTHGVVARDRRNRLGLASARELRREASTAAARRRATQTRPSVAGRSAKHLRRLPANEVGYPLGRSSPRGPALWPSWEASLRLVAPPGEGKTFRVLAPILRQHPGPALATSTKADLYELTAVARQQTGPVLALDPDQLAPAAAPVRWSPVAGCESSQVAERRAAALVAAAGDDNDAPDGAFFRDSARDLLKAYLHAAALEGLGIRAVLEWSRRPEDPTPAEVLLASPSAAPGWGDLVVLHTTGAAETTSGVLRYVARALACFSHRQVIEASSPPPGEEVDIAKLLASKGTVYLLGKGTRLGAVAPLITAFADEVFDTAERLAATMPGRRLDPPLLGLLDEAPSIAPLPSLPELLADGRGRGIVMVYAMQSFSQAVTRWGLHRAETMGNATSITAVLGGLASPGDLGNLERLCGQRRARRESTHRGPQDHSHTTSWEDQPVLRADQIRTLPAGVALVLWGRLPPVLAHLPLLCERPEWRQVQQEERITREANDRARRSQASSSGIATMPLQAAQVLESEER